MDLERGTLGEQELEMLRYIAGRGAVSVGEVNDGFGTPHGLTRSTVVTVMERLRKKNYLTRQEEQGVYRYRSLIPQEELLGGLVKRFVEKTLAGSLTPFVTYFSRNSRLSAEELGELERLVAKMQESPSAQSESDSHPKTGESETAEATEETR